MIRGLGPLRGTGGALVATMGAGYALLLDAGK
jgi:hypothetical protein